jgi:hypothetical protein
MQNVSLNKNGDVCSIISNQLITSKSKNKKQL